MEKNKKELAVKTENGIRHYDLEKPEQMTKMALVIQTHITKHNLYTNIKGKNYAHVEGWQFAGGLLGVLPMITEVIDLSTEKEKKYRAAAVLKRGDEEVGGGAGLCSSLEVLQTDRGTFRRWTDEYAVLSMAQTRAIGKAFRNTIGWVMKMAHYEGTPAEEMTGFKNNDPKDGTPIVEYDETLAPPSLTEKTKNDIIKAAIIDGGRIRSIASLVSMIRKKEGYENIEKLEDLTEADGRRLLAGLLNRKNGRK
ncbi:MAG: hypothetical protein KGI72_05255 [Patescibacteria group bacterium]|nr:hypothetical protein [Patescibacteria group bacterium]